MLSIIGRNPILSPKVISYPSLFFVGFNIFLFSVGSMQTSSKKFKPKGFWREVENRRAFFSEFAQSKGFDPLDFQRWKEVSLASFIEHQVLFLHEKRK